MKISLTVLTAIIFLLSSDIWSQENNYEEVVYLKDGSVIRGQIIEQKIGEYIKITMRNGTEIEISYSDIDRIVKEEMAVAATQTSSGRKNKLEKWYLNLTLGYGFFGVPDATRKMLDRMPGESVTIGVREAIYWPLKDKKTIVGFSLDLTGESRGNTDSVSYSVLAMSFNLISVQHFFQSCIGDGLYGGLEAGPVLLTQGFSNEPKPNSSGGFHIGLEGGYLWPIGSGGTRIGASAKTSLTYIKGNTTINKGFYNSLIIGFNVLW